MRLLPAVLGVSACWALSAGVRGATDQSPPLPDAVVDLRTDDGAAAVRARWRYADAEVVETEHRAAGADNRPSGAPVRTHDISPRADSGAFDSASWQDIPPGSLEQRRTNGRLAFGWYRLDLTIPERIGAFPTAGSTIVLEVVVDDYAEVWVDGEAPQVLGQRGGRSIAGWNAPNRVIVRRGARPDESVRIAIFAANGPLSNPPPNYVWIRSATLDFYAQGREPSHPVVPVAAAIERADPAFDGILAPDARVERLAEGFSFTEGPLWIPGVGDARTGGAGPAGGSLLFSDPNRNVIHRFDPLAGEVSIFRTKSGYSGTGGAPIGEYHQPGSNGLALDPQGRITICEHGNRRVTRLEPNGSITVLADRFEGHRLNSPNDLVYRSDGALYFTDPPYGLPKVYDDPRKELPYSGVYCLFNGQLKLVSTDLAGPNGLAFTPDEKHLYVGNWDEQRKVVLRYDAAPDGALSNPVVFVDLTSVKGEICLDGLKVDGAGNVYVSGPGGVWVFSAAGRHLGTISPPELPANFAFGDDDRRTLYMTARTGLYRVRLNVPGSR